jgi:hypothetical protein
LLQPIIIFYEKINYACRPLSNYEHDVFGMENRKLGMMTGCTEFIHQVHGQGAVAAFGGR